MAHPEGPTRRRADLRVPASEAVGAVRPSL